MVNSNEGEKERKKEIYNLIFKIGRDLKLHMFCVCIFLVFSVFIDTQTCIIAHKNW